MEGRGINPAAARCRRSVSLCSFGKKLSETLRLPRLAAGPFESNDITTPILELRPELHKAFNPWDRINEPEGLRQMLREEGVEADAVTAENRWHPIQLPEGWWTIVLGSGYRGTVEQLPRPSWATVKEANVAFVSGHKITRLETNALYAIATKKSI